jgi:hypothetical protein
MEFVKVPEGKSVEFAPSTWLFAAISLPLTLVVFLLWFWLHGSVHLAVLRRFRELIVGKF